jgi:tetratricopeptide (TPR) repeat protein
MANILVTMALLQRELGRLDDAVRALKQSIELFTPLIETDPDPPLIRERLANAELNLAYTLYWGGNPTETVAPQVELQCRKALERFDDLEREWPARRQPVVLCLRILSDAAHQRGDRIEALRLLREAIARGQAYVIQHPDSDATRAEIGRTCAKQWDRLTDDAKLHSKDGEQVLNAGLHQVDEILRRSPDSTQAADLSAALHFRLALQFFHEDRVDDALPQLNVAITGIEQLCTNFPYNTDYWNSAEWFNFESVKRLHAANRAVESQRVALTYFKWLKEIAPQVAEKPESKAKLAESQAALVASFHILNMDREAEQAALIVSQATSHLPH